MDILNSRTNRATKRSLAAVIAGAMFAALLAVVAASPAAANVTVTQTDIAGVDRYATSALVATKTYTSGTNAVVLVNGENFADGLAASALAGVVGGPVLLTHPTSLQGSTGNALGALDSLLAGKMHVYLVGGESAISAAQSTYLSSNLKYTVTRVSGADRYATAAAVADTIHSKVVFGVNPYNSRTTAILVSGTGFADGLSVSGIAFNKKFPVLLTDGTSLTAETKAVLDNNTYNIQRVIIVGGESAVSAAVATEVDALKNGALGTTDVEIMRLSGADRYATAVEVAKYSRKATNLDGLGWSITNIVLASGENFPDALSAAARAGTGANDALILTAGSALNATSDAWIKTVDTLIATLDVLGGESAISATTSAAAKAAAAYNRPTVTITGVVQGGTVVTLVFSEKMTTLVNAVMGVDANTDNDCADSGGGDVAAVLGTGLQTVTNVEVNNLDRTVNAAGTANGCQTLSTTEAIVVCDLTATSANYKKKCTVTLGTALATGDVFSFGGTATTISLAGSRALAEASATVAADVVRPTVTIGTVTQNSGVIGYHLITLSETPQTTFAAADVKCMQDSADTEVAATSVTKIAGLTYEVVCPGADNPADSTGYIQVEAAAWTDLGGNAMLADVTKYAIADTAKWSATASVGALAHTDRSTIEFETGSGANDAGDLTVSSKKNGACDGALGNSWSLKYIDNNGAPAISIYDSVTKVITVTGDPDASVQLAAPTAQALAGAMNAHAEFAACWTAVAKAVGSANLAVTTAVSLAAGTSYKTITVTYNEPVRHTLATTVGNYDVSSNGVTADANNTITVGATSNGTTGVIYVTTSTDVAAQLPVAGVSKVEISTNILDLRGNAHAATQKVVMG
jgi:putative cell wall-binding protein